MHGWTALRYGVHWIERIAGVSCHCPKHRVEPIESDLSTPAKIRWMPRKRDGCVGEIDDNSSCCITSSRVVIHQQPCTSPSIVALAAARRLHSAHAHEAAGSSGRQADAAAIRTLAPTPPFAEPTPQLPGLHPKAPPDVRLSLLLVFSYMKGSSCICGLAAAADDLGSCEHA